MKGSSFTFSDFGINANEYYHYLATIEKKDTEGNVEYVSYENIVDGQPRYLQAKWDKFSLHDIIFDNDNQLYNVSGPTWLLYCNVESNEITQRTSVTSHEYEYGDHPMEKSLILMGKICTHKGYLHVASRFINRQRTSLGNQVLFNRDILAGRKEVEA